MKIIYSQQSAPNSWTSGTGDDDDNDDDNNDDDDIGGDADDDASVAAGYDLQSC